MGTVSSMHCLHFFKPCSLLFIPFIHIFLSVHFRVLFYKLTFLVIILKSGISMQHILLSVSFSSNHTFLIVMETTYL